MRLKVGLVALIVLLSFTLPVTGSITAADSAPDGTECGFPHSTTDATGTEITLTEEPDRVVTVWPSAAQPVWDIGAADKVVGTTKWAHYLDGAENRTNISGQDGGISSETVVGLEPDLVLAAYITDQEVIELLRQADVKVYQFEEPTTIDDIKHNVQITGRVLGHCDGASQTVEWMNQTINRVETAVAGKDKPRVLYVTAFNYGPGTGTFAHKIIETAGGENIMATADVEGWAMVNEEIVINQDPEWIILNDRSPQVPDSPAFNATTAVQQDQIVVVGHPYLNQAAPRVVYAMVTIANAIHDANIEVADPQDWDSEHYRANTRMDSQDQSAIAIGLAGIAIVAGGYFYWRKTS